jgi:Dolichyl-phosphate-mannose-protein mannosyltransferase
MCCALAVLALYAFFDAALLHGGYRHMREGIRFVPMAELVFLFWYLVWGGLAMGALAAGAYLLAGRSLLGLFERVRQRSAETLVLLALPMFVGILALRSYVLAGEPVADDELVYELTARNISLGKLTSVPPIDPDFLRNQFVLVDAQRWHGKYPVGHSLLLAPFELLGRVDLLAPLLALASLALTYALARRFVGARAAVVPPLLLALSPHFLLTHATLLSQTTSCMLVLLAVFASLRHAESGQARWLWLMGSALGFGLLTRPLPVALVALVVIAEKLATSRGRLLRDAVSWGAPLALCTCAFLAVNFVQSGSPWSNGYKEFHNGVFGMFQNIQGELPNSLGGALVRENAWLFGWPCSLLFVPFARVERKRALLWGTIAAVYLYRALVPKTVVASTGPIYVTELLPWLCIASAAGMQRVLVLLHKLEVSEATSRLAALVLAGFVVSAVAFVPIELRELARGARARDEVKRALFDEGVSRALVFCDQLVAEGPAVSWAYYAPNPWPDLRDDVLYLRIPQGTDGPERALELWRTRFADRPAFVYRPFQERGSLQKLHPRKVNRMLAGQPTLTP